MQYLPGTKIICLTYSEMVPSIFTAENFRQAKKREYFKVHGRNGQDKESLIEYGSLTRRSDREKVIKQYGDPRLYIVTQPILELLVPDQQAADFFSGYKYKNGQYIDITKQVLWNRSVQWLNAIKMLLADKEQVKERWGSIGQFWTSIVALIRNDGNDREMTADEVHDLPGSEVRLKCVYRAYVADGYKSLVDEWRMGNDFARKVTPKIEILILSLWARRHQPYLNEVCADYRKFINGEITLIDPNTGEYFDPKDFYIQATGQRQSAKKGKAVLTVPYELGESTVDYYVKKPGNEAIINKLRMRKITYDSVYRPSVKRIAAAYAFSKLTMDDIDIPFQGPDGSRVVKSYQVFDCASQAVVGYAFSKEKNMELIMECMRDMFRLIIRKGWGVPWQIEMERHLTSAMKGKADKVTGEITEDIFTPAAVFPSTQICHSPQAKRAEGFIKRKKYDHQKKREGFAGRFYARLLTNRLNEDQKLLRRAYEDIVDNEIADIEAYNNELHPKQELYPGLTRWQVLEQHQNPQLPKFQPGQVIQFIGFSTKTSIRAGVAKVQYGEYMLPDINLIKKTHYNGEIIAYYLPDEHGIVNSVYLYEDGQFLCEAQKKAGFQEAYIERTADDVEIMQHQLGQQSAFDKMVKDGLGALVPVAVIQPKAIETKKRGVVKSKPKQEDRYIPSADSLLSARERAYRDI